MPEADAVFVGADDSPDILDLLATTLDRGISFLRRRGFDRGYINRVETIQGVRGRARLWESARTGGLRNGILRCEYDEFSHDVIHNRILKGTLRLLLSGPVSKKLKVNLYQHHVMMDEVADIQISLSDFSRCVLHRNNAFYGFLLKVCRLVFLNMIPLQNGKGYEFRDFTRDSVQMGHIFEDFVRNFLSWRTPHKARREQISWLMTGSDEASKRLLPKMKTDISFLGPRGKTIIECKFGLVVSRGQFESDRLRSGHLYQLHAYLTNLPDLPENEGCGGLLLYPSNGVSYSLEYRALNRVIRVATLDLEQQWPQIEQDLRGLVV